MADCYLTDPQGGHYSTLDADSEGEEGRYYLWTPKQVDDVLGDNAQNDNAPSAAFVDAYDVTDAGNLDGKSTLAFRGDSRPCSGVQRCSARQKR